MATVKSEATSQPHVWISEQLSRPREIAFIAVVSACQLFTQSGLGMSIAPLHVIGRELGIDDEPAYLSWSPAAYSLTVGTFILIAGRMGDLYGHKKMVIVGWVWYGFWSLIGGELQAMVCERHQPGHYAPDLILRVRH